MATLKIKQHNSWINWFFSYTYVSLIFLHYVESWWSWIMTDNEAFFFGARSNWLTFAFGQYLAQFRQWHIEDWTVPFLVTPMPAFTCAYAPPYHSKDLSEDNMFQAWGSFVQPLASNVQVKDRRIRSLFLAVLNSLQKHK